MLACAVLAILLLQAHRHRPCLHIRLLLGRVNFMIIFFFVSNLGFKIGCAVVGVHWCVALAVESPLGAFFALLLVCR